ncbi:MAG: nucleotidyltransferase domain-containing protein [Nitrososphaerota archaeon]|nr:nucleotidyltransferase domain-containing protein [Nitrososphaerota archaeon]
MTKLNQKLSEHFNNTDVTIVVAGSFGRFDAGKPSDLDFYVVSNNARTSQQIHKTVTKFAKELKLKLPNTAGIFSKALELHQIITKMGYNHETPDELAQRLLLLLETQPIYNMEFYEKAVNGILDKYFDLHKKHPYKEAVILLNDLIKYFRYICMNYQFNFWDNNEKWVIRNIKLRHSRVIMYAGLLFVLLNASKHCIEKTEYIKKMIKLTPIERINSVLTENGVDPSPLFECYDKYLYNINNVSIRKSFDICPLEYTDRYNNKIFKELKTNSDCLQTFLTNSVLIMREIWSQKAFEYLIF